jgi:predicted nucleotidyltransferase
MKTAPLNEFEKYLSEIVEKLAPMDPKSIIVFGSLARGKSDKESDIDLLIILDSKEIARGAMERIKRKALFRKAIMEISYRVPIDLIVLTETEIGNSIREGNTFYAGIVRTGKKIYERTYGSVA